MTQKSDDAELNVSELLARLAENGVADALKDPEIQPFFLDALQEAGLSGLQSRITFALLRGLAIRSINFATDAASGRLAVLIERLPLLPKLLKAVSAIDLKARDTNKLSQTLSEKLTGSEFETSATANLELLQASYLLKTTNEFSDSLNEVLDDIQTLSQSMDRFNQAFQSYTEPPLNWPQVAEGTTLSAAASLKYNAGRYALVGRDTELDLLAQFLGDLTLQGDKHRFRWLLITGPGGEGKSRLAFDFCQQLEKEGIWHAGRLYTADLKKFNANHWNPVRPTLIVIDYPIAAPVEVGELLSGLVRNAKDFYFPVRVLLLERDAGEWFSQAVPETSDGVAVRSHAAIQNSAEDTNSQLAYPLLPLGQDAILALMRSRLAKSTFSNEFSDDDLFNLACRIDNRQLSANLQASPRALFAIAATEVLVTEKQNHPEKTGGQLLREQTRNKVLNSIIERDRQMRWLPASNKSHASLAAHENLLALATACGGLTLEQLGSAPETSGEYLPDPAPTSRQDLNRQILDAMTRLGEDETIPPLEPDILGEHFVIMAHERLMPARRRQCFVNTAFSLDPNGTANFVLRALADFPDEMENAGLFAPDSNAGAKAAWGFALIGVAITARGDSADSSRLINQVIDRIDRLRGEFPEHEEIALEEAKAAVNITNYAGETGDWERVDRALNRLEDLQGEFPRHEKIALEEAKAAVNITLHAWAAGDWKRVDRALNRLDHLRGEFPEHEEIALEEAKAAVNITGHAGAAGDWERVDQMTKRAADLSQAFGEEASIHCMTVAVVLLSFYFRFSHGTKIPQNETREISRLALQRIQCSVEEDSDFLVGPSLQIVKTADNLLPGDSQVLEVKETLESMGADFAEIPEIPRNDRSG